MLRLWWRLYHPFNHKREAISSFMFFIYIHNYNKHNTPPTCFLSFRPSLLLHLHFLAAAIMVCEDASGENTENGFMLFGVRVVTDGSIRKCVSMNNLSQYEHADQQTQVGDGGNCATATAGYASDDAVQASAGSHGRKRGVPWTEEEHRLFLIGLQKVGKGDWRGISRNFVKTRSPTQVASHAQKYFLRHNNRNRRRRRSSLFDITTSSVFPEQNSEEEIYIEGNIQTPIPGPDGALDLTLATFLVPTPDGPIVEEAVSHPDERNGVKIVKPIPVISNGPLSAADSYDNMKMGLVASPLTVEVVEGHESRPSAFQTLGSFSREEIDNNGSMISVA